MTKVRDFQGLEELGELSDHSQAIAGELHGGFKEVLHLLAGVTSGVLEGIQAGVEEPLMSKSFLPTLKGLAQKWFLSLPSRSIRCFNDLADQFLTYYAVNIKPQRNLTHLSGVHQDEGETLKAYLARWQKEVQTIKRLDEQVAITLFMEFLRAGKLFIDLHNDRPKTYVEAILRASRQVAFLPTLKGLAQKWFLSLPSCSIRCFNDLADQFLTHYAVNIKPQRNLTHLSGVHQDEGETLKAYLTRWQKEVQTIERLDEQVAITLFKESPCAGKLFIDLHNDRPKTYVEAILRASRQANTKEAVKQKR
nr:uncharacterized protein LOC109150821 [Ipomoea trifida]